MNCRWKTGINDEVRVILEAFQDDMRKTGASYPEMSKR